MTIIIGIDPHKASHTAVAIDHIECGEYPRGRHKEASVSSLGQVGVES